MMFAWTHATNAVKWLIPITFSTTASLICLYRFAIAIRQSARETNSCLENPFSALPFKMSCSHDLRSSFVVQGIHCYLK